VLLEATVLGAVSSLVGIAAGALLVQLAVVVLGRMDLEVPIPQSVALSPESILVPLLVGVAVTVTASLVPARAATRVSPLAALRPADPEGATGRSGTFRIVSCALLVLGGAALM